VLCWLCLVCFCLMLELVIYLVVVGFLALAVSQHRLLFAVCQLNMFCWCRRLISFGFCRSFDVALLYSYDILLFLFIVSMVCWLLAFARSVGSEADASRPLGLWS
jgi:hypothetical protein